MTHFAKLAAIGFRMIGIAGLFYCLLSLIETLHVSRMLSYDMSWWGLVSVSLFPVAAMLLYFLARPLGEFVAQGFE